MALDLVWQNYVIVGIAALLAGFINALAGGGTLISFPALTAIGIPAVAANVTNTIALVPGYLGATIAQIKDLRSQKQRLWFYLPAGAIGGIIGGYLLLNTGEETFRNLVPFLILLASFLLAISDKMREWLVRRMGKGTAAAATMTVWGILPIGLASVYGGYFGAGLSVIILAVLGLVLSDTLNQLNALKQIIAFMVNVAAAFFFVFSENVVWPLVFLMAICSLAGGAIGGRFASRVKPATLRWLVVVIGVSVAVVYFITG
jgi:uncharacterized membrane protein YfcA